MMTKPAFDSDLKKEWDLQLNTELEATFPASDPLKVTRFPVSPDELHVGKEAGGSRRDGASQHRRIPGRHHGKGHP